MCNAIWPVPCVAGRVKECSRNSVRSFPRVPRFGTDSATMHAVLTTVPSRARSGGLTLFQKAGQCVAHTACRRRHSVRLARAFGGKPCHTCQFSLDLLQAAADAEIEPNPGCRVQQTGRIPHTARGRKKNSATMLLLEGITKSFTEANGHVLPILDIPRFSVAAGSDGAVGSQRSGKTTLLHIIAGIARTGHRSVGRDGVDITRLSEPGRIAIEPPKSATSSNRSICCQASRV